MVSMRVAFGLLICCLSGFAFAHAGGVDEDGCHKDSRDHAYHCHPERAKHAKTKSGFDREHPPKPGDEGVFYGPLIKVIDGDTFTAKVQGVVMRFRLQGVDAPEHDQPYGSIATAELRGITKDQQLVLVFDDVDKWGRVVVQAWVGNLDVNAEMVRRGAAWFESEWSDDNRLHLIEDEARDQKVGLWALPGRHIEPWVWRKEQR
jgi:endonuclease YncB( thermonuclease family)